MATTELPASHRWKAGGSHILNAIPRLEYELLLPALKPAPLVPGQVLYGHGAEILDCYFISSALISCVQVMQNGDTVEVGIFGAEGFAGYPTLLGINQSSALMSVQIGGDAFKVDVSVLRHLLPRLPSLERLLLRFGYIQMLQMQQIAACNGLHEIEQRLASWILMMQDRVHSDTLPLTHDLLAGMLGSRRASITVAAGALQKAGGIAYRRGKLQIVQREKLEEAACECYGHLRLQLQSFVHSFNIFRPYLF